MLIHNILIILLIQFIFITAVIGDLYEVRCKCICPRDTELTRNRTLFIDVINKPEECHCERVVGNDFNSTDDTIKELIEDICHQCECTFEKRLPLLNWVVIGVVFLLLIGMTVYTLIVQIYSFLKVRTKRMTPWGSTTILPEQEEMMRSHTYKAKLRARTKKWQETIAKQRNIVYGNPNLHN